jgi:predicted nucleic acid-binding protein
MTLFVDYAGTAEANFILTGDTDLLGMNPWRGLAIMKPAA